ncbi:putative ADH1-alcohol dehydrogenase I [Clavulina sp. PMI_390]|nr:putative ADH1-alcohol dehydrogenase I [Clavulina sp. PMI_390]
MVVEDGPVTQPEDLKPGEVLVKLIYSGVCHTDLHVMKGDWPLQSKLPCIGGHEGAGYVVAIGKNTATDLTIGSRVGIKWLAYSCGACELCRKGYESSCLKAECSGFSVDGTFQQYCVSFADHVTPIPDGLSLKLAAPIMCAGVTVWKAIKAAELTPGETIVISGAGGGLGHLAIQYAVSIGLRVVALDAGAEKRALCTKLGAETFIDFSESKDLVGDLKKACGGTGPHAAIVTASSAKAYEQALDYLRNGGVLVVVGLPADAYIRASVFFTVFRSLRIVGSYVGNRADAVQAVDFAARDKVTTTVEELPLSALPKVFDDMSAGKVAGRIVLNLWENPNRASA